MRSSSNICGIAVRRREPPLSLGGLHRYHDPIFQALVCSIECLVFCLGGRTLDLLEDGFGAGLAIQRHDIMPRFRSIGSKGAP